MLFESLPLEYRLADGDTPESTRRRAIVFEGVALPAAALMLLSLSAAAAAQDGLASPGTAGVLLALCILLWSVRFWVDRHGGRDARS